MDRNRKSVLPIALVMLLALLLAACGSATTEIPQVAVEDLPTAEVSVVEQPEEAGAAAEAEGEAEVVEEATSEELVLEPGFELGPPGLRASDPSTFSLASGQVQLLEFFAFW